MPIEIRPFTEEMVAAVREFNARLRAAQGSQAVQFPESPVPRWLPRKDGRRPYVEIFLAIEDAAVRGGYLLKHQDFWFGPDRRPVGFFRWMVSEGIVNRRYSWVALRMLNEAQRQTPLLHGWASDALVRLLALSGWSIHRVPFFFKVNHPGRFLKEIPALRTTPIRRWAADAAAVTGAGAVILRTMQACNRRKAAAEADVERVRGFSAWADDLWARCRERYAMIGSRDTATLNALYPADNERFLCYRVVRDGADIGWVVALDTQMSGDKHFANLRVGSIVDCLASPEDAPAVIRAAAAVLDCRGVDLIVSNQSHQSWGAALRQAGFLRSASNLRFAASKELAARLQPFPARMAEVHYTRGDGEGPIHL